MRTIQNFADVSSTAVKAANASFAEMLKKARAIDPTAYIDNTIHDEWCIRCAPEKEAEVRAALGLT